MWQLELLRILNPKSQYSNCPVFGKIFGGSIHASYYYQVQCQLGISEVERCFFVVWSPETVHNEEIIASVSFFQENVAKTNQLIKKAVLPEIIG